MPISVYYALGGDVAWFEGRDEQLKALTEKVKANFNLPIQLKCPIDGYGRLARMLRDNIEFDENSKKVVHLGLPSWVGKFSDGMNVIFTMFEADQLPPKWPADINAYYDCVITPSTWCKRVFTESGVTVPIHVVPLAVDNFDIYRPKDRPFTFGHQNSFILGAQKGWDLVIEAFEQEFTPKDNVRLLLKMRSIHKYACDAKWMKRAAKNKRIEIIDKDFSDKQMHEDFYGRLNCFVYPSRGEGFGLPPVEAMAHGIPTIMTDAHSMHDFANLGVGIGTTGYCDSYYYGRIEDSVAGKWVEPDFNALRVSMRSIYDDYKQAKAKAVKNAAKIEELYSPEVFINNFVNLVNNL